MMHAISEELLCSQGNLTLSKFESSKMSHKGQYQTCPICWCGDQPHKGTASYRQYLRSHCFHKAAWPWASFKVQKGHTKVNIKLIWDYDVEYTTIKLQLDTEELLHSQGPSGCCLSTGPVIDRQPPASQRQYPSSLRGWGVKIYIEDT